MINRILAPFLRLPYFRGKSRLESVLLERFCTPEVTTILHGLRMELDAYEGIQLKLLRGDWTEPHTLKLYEQILGAGDVFVDVGAHVGFHSLVARARVGPTGRVVAIEPQPYNAAKIIANAAANSFDNIDVFVAAVGLTDDLIALHEQDRFERSCLSIGGGAGDRPQRYFVSLLRLDSVLRRAAVDHVKLMKIDVEGYEADALEGLGNELSAIDNIVFEALVATSAQRTNVERVASLLQGVGFALKTVVGDSYAVGSAPPERNVWATRIS